jgi:hypothetical protein
MSLIAKIDEAKKYLEQLVQEAARLRKELSEILDEQHRVIGRITTLEELEREREQGKSDVGTCDQN